MMYRAVVLLGNRLPLRAKGARDSRLKHTHSSRLAVIRKTLREQLPAPAGLKK
jgi:hypothetical protein